MSSIAKFLAKMILSRFFVILLCISVFVISLETVNFLTEIFSINQSPTLAILHYATIRLPVVLAVFLPMSMLLALLIAITELTYRNEMTAIFATGISPLRIIIMLLPVAALIGGFHFFLLDRAIPIVSPTLKVWGIGDYAKNKTNMNSKGPVWIRSGDDLLRLSKASKDGNSFSGIIIFKRNAEGQLLEQIHAETATKQRDLWQLQNVTVYYTANQAPQQLKTLEYMGHANAANASRTGDPEDMTIGQLSTFIANEGYGVRPVFVYETTWHKRLTTPFVSLVMLMLCIPMAARFRRGGGLGALFLVGVGLGFLFFIADGISTTMGELGVVRPWLAAWTPIIVFAAIGISFVARTERT